LPFSGAGSIKALSIDLDNTLWDVLPTLVAAEAVLEQWLSEHCPTVLPHYKPEVTGPIRDELVRVQPDRAHDLSFLRRRVMHEVFARAGAESTLVEPAFEVFFVARNQVTLYDDVVPALTRLADRFALVALTDGNADLRMVGLDTYFDHYVNATAVGAAKPAAAMFAAVKDYTGYAAEEILHIGDDPDKDVMGANSFGMRSAWVNRNRDPWPEQVAGPDVQVDSLGALTDQLLGVT
jgi:HAD superfamily hydrolase (TIGR01549 family)